ncbi:Rha family transcriptional regulator [Paenibacillus woosongensis]|uniref:ORF6C domain-containing protein n=1 Tax=Paenibacillus woosongensis TaxID=307580 RepID=A0ABQ4MZ55_9BACL|nr:Rha family transcriptional regulator [Paenibacillus woosongensis]GIP61160.1 hypothetical protein J15TS10_49740 [Paenibacillus woosongensis]
MKDITTVVPTVQQLLDEDFVYVEDGIVKTDSRRIASKFGKRHADVLRSIKNLECSTEFTERNFTHSQYIDGSGRRLPVYTVTRDGFTFLITGFTGKEAAKFKEDFIAAFNWMEKQLLVAQTPSENPLLIQTVKQLEEQIQEVTEQLENQVTILTNEQKIIQQAIGRRVINLTIKNESKRSELFRQLYRAFYVKFKVTSYRDLLKKDFESALKFIALWKPKV